MIIKNGRVFQEDGTFAEKDLYIEGKRFVSTKERSDRSGSDRCERHDGSAGTG
mgnify:CR=1 FL=1